jgi:hypothetical protein
MRREIIMEYLVNWLLASLGVFLSILLLMVLAGCFLSRRYRFTWSLDLPAPVESVWQVLRDHAGTPQWFDEVTQVERLPDRNGHEVWKETYQNNYGLVLETTEETPPTRLVRTVVKPKGPFKGRWEFALTPTADGCRVELTEFGEIANPFFRVMARLFLRPELYVQMYLAALSQHFDPARSHAGLGISACSQSSD